MLDLRRRISNDLEEIPGVVSELESALQEAGVGDRDIYQLTLCVDEVLTNIVSYAFPEGGDHDIDLSIHQDEDVVTVNVIDHGIAFDLTRDAKPAETEASLEERDPGHLGIHIVATFMDEVSYERRDEQNHLIMTKTISRDRT